MKDPTKVGRKKDDGRSLEKTGWHSDGVAFYHKAVQFFKKVQMDERFKGLVREARDMRSREI